MAWPGEVLALFIEGLGDRERQVQPAGIDLRAAEIYRAAGPGLIGREERRVPYYIEVEPQDGYWRLRPGYYIVRFAETVEIPGNAVGICLPRSTLLRMGAVLHCALWDPGYKGRGYALLTVHNEHGMMLEKGARIAQMIYIGMPARPASTYKGVYQGEGVWR